VVAGHLGPAETRPRKPTREWRPLAEREPASRTTSEASVPPNAIATFAFAPGGRQRRKARTGLRSIPFWRASKHLEDEGVFVLVGERRGIAQRRGEPSPFRRCSRARCTPLTIVFRKHRWRQGTWSERACRTGGASRHQSGRRAVGARSAELAVGQSRVAQTETSVQSAPPRPFNVQARAQLAGT